MIGVSVIMPVVTILRPPQEVPTRRNMTVKHPDDLIVEYVEPIKLPIGHHS
ncbi:MAG: hypothetical protein KME57_05685 [Scytonema hyalinum WJT4-NPBG1]|nr:hypothetical protein [Scytonema hyalinum WJT4-NPBG1]